MPRGVMDCKASDHDDTTVDARFGKVGRQVCTDTGPLSSKRMETIDDETTGRAIDFMKEQSKADKPFFVWMNTTRMHVFTHVRPEYKDKGGMAGNTYADGMWEHDQDVGKLLKSLDEMGIADNTIVVYTTDNGPNQFTWPDAATTPFRNEKDSNYEGAFRVPAMVRWPGHVKAGQVSNEIFSGMDWFPTLLAAAGDTSIKERLLKGASIGGQSFKNHLDGYNQLPYLEGKQAKSERKEFYYFDDDGVLVDMRYGDWKFVYCEQRAPGGFAVWNNPLTCLRVPKIFNLRMDPYERADVVSDQYYDWTTKNVYVLYGAIAETARFLDTFVAYPPAQTPASFTVDGIRAGVDAEIARNNARAKAMTKKSD
jgi:arylsulfatase